MGTAELVTSESSSTGSAIVTHSSVNRKLRNINNGSQKFSLRTSQRKLQESTDIGFNTTATFINTCEFIEPTENPWQPQKNWSPFVHNGSVFLVERINPLHIVSINHTDCHAQTVSQSPTTFNLAWNYGEIRGGTNAVLVRNHLQHTFHKEHSHVYMAFFHSNKQIPGNYVRTYFFGLYIFRCVYPAVFDFCFCMFSPPPEQHARLYL
jgi:hypothetical protein